LIIKFITVNLFAFSVICSAIRGQESGSSGADIEAAEGQGTSDTRGVQPPVRRVPRARS